jgi:class 3 adenylate cyclase
VASCPTCGTSNPDGAKFCQECGAPQGVLGERRRRLVTTLFCDLVGSTDLAERLDAEHLRRVLDGYFDAMRSAIGRHGGSVEKFIGDAVVGTFGIPETHEDDALRAVRAALDMRSAAEELDSAMGDRASVRIRVRIAINSGEAFADEAAAVEGRIGGDVFNTAARLQNAADPGDVLISASTERLLRGHVDMEPLGAVELKGKAEPVVAFRVLGVRTLIARAETPFVGRERPMRVLGEALQEATEAQASVLVTVLAPPGVGKSRLASAFADAVRDRATVLVGRTPAYGDGVTFAPLVDLLAHAAGLPGGDAAEIAKALQERVAAEPDGLAVGDRLAQALGIGEAIAADVSWAVRRLLEILAAERPVVAVLEDVHWAEPPMLDLADAVAERVHGPVVVLCLARPELLEMRPSWAAGKARAVTTTLPPLSLPDARRVAELLLGPTAPASVVARVCDAAEGNPLFLEQLTAMLSDQGLLVEGRWVGPPDADVEIPAGLQALLTARLDRLDPVSRLVLQLASVEGRRFRIDTLRALATDVATDEIESAVAGLDRRGLVEPEEEARGRWRFAHALVVEAAYRSLSKERRAELHELFADRMVEVDADQPDVDEVVARHLERALHLREELGMRDERSAALSARAGELFAAAGLRAFASLDLVTAGDLLGRAERLLPEGSRRRLELLPNLGVALSETGRPQETETLLVEAVREARAAGWEREALRASIQLLSNAVYRSPSGAEIDGAIVEARAAADVFEGSGDEVGLAEAAIAIEYLEYMRGHAEGMHRWASRALAAALTSGRPREAGQAAADVTLSAVDGPTPFARFPGIAARISGAGDDPISQSAAHALTALAALAVDDADAFDEHEQRWRDVVDRNGLTILAAALALPFGTVEMGAGRADRAERRLRQARDLLVAQGDVWWLSTTDALLCAAVGAQDRPRDFLRLADAFEASPFVPDRYVQIRRQLIRAQALLVRGESADAEAAARGGIELAATSDLVISQAGALLMLADVLEARGLDADAATARRDAADKLRAKGFLAAVRRLGA